jgi:hypothetical protein
MPVARLEGQRLRAGTHAASALTTTYNIAGLAVQADQSLGVEWCIDSSGTTPPKPARVTVNADESESDDGFYTFAWRMSYMTNLMLSHWLSTFLPGGVRSAPVTVLTYTEADVAIYLTGLIRKPEFPSSDAQYAIGGWGNVIWRFRRGVQIFP